MVFGRQSGMGCGDHCVGSGVSIIFDRSASKIVVAESQMQCCHIGSVGALLLRSVLWNLVGAYERDLDEKESSTPHTHRISQLSRRLICHPKLFIGPLLQKHTSSTMSVACHNVVNSSMSTPFHHQRSALHEMFFQLFDLCTLMEGHSSQP